MGNFMSILLNTDVPENQEWDLYPTTEAQDLLETSPYEDVMAFEQEQQQQQQVKKQ